MQSIMRVLSGLLVTGLMGCTPAHNWREVHHPDGLWSATFPDKPVQVARVVQVPTADGDTLTGVSMSLWSSRVGEQTFTIGVTESKNHPVSQLQSALIHARLKNIGADTSPAVSGDASQNIDRMGQMRLDPNGPSVQARLMLRTKTHGTQVIEAIVAGPIGDFDAEAAETFIQSARLTAE